MKKTQKKQKIGIQEIADALKVSVSTVSRALNDHPRISLQTKEKVKRMALKLGYQANIPELMVPEKAEAIAVFTPDMEDKLCREIVLGITDFMDDRDYLTFVIDSHQDEKSLPYFFHHFRKFGLSGVIHIMGSRKRSEELYRSLSPRSLPMVTVFEAVTRTKISSVLPDLFQSFQNVLTHFKSLHIHSVVLVLENNDDPVDFQIRSSFEMAADTLNMKKNIKPNFIYSKKQSGKLAEVLETLFTKGNKVDALLVKSVDTMSTVYQMAEKAGKKIPEDVLLIAIGPVHEALWKESLSMIKIPAYTMGYEAGGMLLDQMEHGVKEKQTVIKPAGFILKGSAIRLE